MSEPKMNWIEHFRLITPLAIFVLGVYISMVGNQIDTKFCQLKEQLLNIDNKMFIHLTNDDIHTPKNIVVTKAEFDVYQNMRDSQMLDIRGLIADMKVSQEKLLTEILAHAKETKR